MRFLALGDTHLGLHRGRTSQARREMAERTIAQFSYCVKEALHHRVDAVLHTGDIFDRSQPPSWVIQQYYEVIEPLLDADIGLLVIPGNHDRGYLQPSLLDYLYPDYKVFNQLGYHDIDHTRIIGLPYTRKMGRGQLQHIQQWSQRKGSLLLAHQLFFGAWVGPQRFRFRANNCLDIAGLPAHLQIIAGHIHRSQVVAHQHVIYTGSTVRTSFAEAIEPKGYLLGEITPHQVTATFRELPTPSMEVIEINGHTLHLENLDSILEDISPQTPVLLRIVQCRLDTASRVRLLQRYDPSRWPFLVVSPSSPATILAPLYSIYQGNFQDPEINRIWS